MATDRKAYMKKYWAKKEVKEKNRKRAAENYDVSYEYDHSRYPRSRWVHARNGAKRRKLAFTLTFEEYSEIVKNNCYYCNDDISTSAGSSLDRIDNSLGYHVDNVNPCCGSCNRRRSKSMSAEEFRKQSKLNGRWKE